MSAVLPMAAAGADADAASRVQSQANDRTGAPSPLLLHRQFLPVDPPSSGQRPPFTLMISPYRARYSIPPSAPAPRLSPTALSSLSLTRFSAVSGFETVQIRIYGPRRLRCTCGDKDADEILVFLGPCPACCFPGPAPHRTLILHRVIQEAGCQEIGT
ncbi:hypothetical protein BP5796_01510 [Coleophoma crateriformis]|uniref:Uncharacterized protein n=1 Tax=Coleophoma crateriformis TaxID=565419 RepID=A0A3D8T0N4_9HELO|nr:hypothetical protein BP5796_01510 [Coleophoma crateriformis]